MIDEGLETFSYYDVDGEIPGNYNVIGVPAAFYISPDGVIKNIAFGADTPVNIVKKINE